MTRIRSVGLLGRTVVLIGALLLVIAAGGVVTADQSGDGTAHSVAQENNETELTAFVAESQGGYVSFSQDSEATAEEEGTPFPALEDREPIQIEAEVSEDGTWESQNLTFPALAVNEDPRLEAEVEVIDGLEGEIDPETGVMTAEGEFRVTIQDASFTYQSVQTTRESGELSGTADFSGDSAEVTLVDNEFPVDERSGSSTIDSFLDLPADEPGENWLVLHMDVSLDQEQLEDRSTEEEETAETQDTETLVLTVLGQAFGFAGLSVAILAMLVTVVARVTGLISLDP